MHYPALGNSFGDAAFKQVLERWRAAFPDIEVTIDDKIAEGDKVAVAWTARGTHRGEFMGIPPTGRKVTSTGITIYRVAAGKIAEERGVGDSLGLVQQLGAIPSPSQGAG